MSPSFLRCALCALLLPLNLRAESLQRLHEELRQSIVERVDEPAQKTIIFFDQGREDLLLQVRYQGPAREFGWVIPVPAAPEIKPASMDCFYDLTRVTGEPLWPEEYDDDPSWAYSSRLQTNIVKLANIPIHGALEVTVLGPEKPNALPAWLAAHRFTLPEKEQALLSGFARNHWYLVAVDITPHGPGSVVRASASAKPARAKKPLAGSHQVSLELPPVLVSFSTPRCVSLPVLSTAGSAPSRVAVFVLSSEPTISRVIFDKKVTAYGREQAEWIRHRPDREKDFYARVGNHQAVFTEADEDFLSPWFLKTMDLRATNLPACARELPRLAGKDWCLTKEAETLAPEELADLAFGPALPMYTGALRTPEGRTLTWHLPQFGLRAVPLLLAGLTSTNLSERRLAVAPMFELKDPRLAAALPALFDDPDPRIRAAACRAATGNWDRSFAPRLAQLLSDPDSRVGWAACEPLQFHREDCAQNIPLYQKLAEEKGVAIYPAMRLLHAHQLPAPTASVVALLITNEGVPMQEAQWFLRGRKVPLDEIMALLTSRSPALRADGLIFLLGLRDRPGTAQIVAMLRDPDEAVRSQARRFLRMLSGQELGPEPEAWEKWWAQNKDTFTPVPRPQPPPPLRSSGFGK